MAARTGSAGSTGFGTQAASAIQVLPFQPHAIIVAEAARAQCYGEDDDQTKRRRMAEEQQWRSNVIDLHRVMSIAQALFLLLEHNNEALLRVAMEIVLDTEASKAIWWQDGWYLDDKRREYFRKVVKEKLAIALDKSREGAVFEEEDDSVSKAEFDAVKARLEKVEGQYHAADKAKVIAEDQVRELTEWKEDAMEKMKALERAGEELRNRIRDMETESGKPVDDPNAAKVAALEQQLKMMEERKNKAEERVKELEAQLASAGKQELLDAQKRLEELEEQLKKLKELADKATREAQAAKDALEKERKTPKPKEEKVKEVVVAKKASGEGAEKINALMEAAEADRRRASLAEAALSEKEEQLAATQAELDELRRLHAAMEARAKEAEARADGAEEDARKWQTAAEAAEAAAEQAMADLASERGQPREVVQKVAVVEEAKPKPKKEVEEKTRPSQMFAKMGPSQEEFDEMMKELEKYKERNRKLRDNNEELKATNADLEDKNQRMLKLLHDIKEQLARITAIAEKKGLGDAVRQIMEESQVLNTLESDEYTCFNRLYDDAKRRMEKQRRIHDEKMGIVRSRMRVGSPSTALAPAVGMGAYEAKYAEREGRFHLERANSPDRLTRDNSRSLSPQNNQGSGGVGGYQSGSNAAQSRLSLYGGLQIGSVDGGGGYGGQHSGRQGHNMGATWSPHGAPPSGRSAGGSGSYQSADEGNLYGTSQQFHVGSLNRSSERPVSGPRNPAGVVGMVRRAPGPSHFAVEGFNPAMGLRPQMPMPFGAGLAGSASAGALLMGSSSPAGSSLSSVQPGGQTPMVVSAMAMDARGRGNSGSPPPPERRRLIESSSAPSLIPGRLGEELPPLNIGHIQSPSPASTFGPRGLRAVGRPRLPGRGGPTESVSSLMPPRKQVDEMLMGKGGSANGANGITGWSLQGTSAADGASP